MEELGIRNITLLCEGLRITGTFIEAYQYSEERFYIQEAHTIMDFCEWADKEIGGGAEGNMEILFQAFINPDNKEAVAAANVIKERIAEINKLIYDNKTP